VGYEDGTNSIEEGRLVSMRCSECGGLERRAFGEFESFRGELTSYAIGWTAGREDRAGHMTIGMGVGNPGGGTFHIAVRTDDDGEWVMGLVDRPFEDVPQGGPDLTREEALAHDTLPYIWLVADVVMEQDRRALWMEHWLKRTEAHAPAPVIRQQAPVTRVIRGGEGEEIAWRLLGEGDDDAELHAVDLSFALDESMLDVLALAPGERAEREAPGMPWIRS
jgi:hypothetical protein